MSDLHVGDQLLREGQWRTIRHVEAFRDCWLTEEQAETYCDRREGYLYCPSSNQSSLLKLANELPCPG